MDFTVLVDLASEKLGGAVLVANDEFFAPKEDLLKATTPVFLEGEYTERGKWMDGWESRRRRTPGHDWCIVRLGARGSLCGFDIDTAHFLGNHPAYASVEAIDLAGADAAALIGAAGWRGILPRAPLRPGSRNLFAATDGAPLTHLRLNICPDGGIARF